MCVCVCVFVFWNCGENIHQKRWGFSQEVGFIAKNGHDFVVREISGVLRAKHLRDIVAVGCVCIGDSTSVVAAKDSPVGAGAEESSSSTN